MSRILHLEDDPRDHKLLRAALIQDGFTGEIDRVDSAEAFRETLSEGCYDLILADYNLRGFNGSAALKIALDVCPDTPFIVVSGAMGDMAVAEILRAGATDFILKDHLDRLGPAIHRALREAQERVARRDAEEAMREARDAAESANRAKDRFLAMLSHELRTPLSPVVMAVAALQHDRELPDKFKDDLAMIRRNIDLEVALIDDLLDLSCVITGKLRLRRAPARLHDLIRHVVTNAEKEAADKSIRITSDLQAQNDHATCDAARFQQVVWNLLRNAIKFTPRGGGIIVRTRNADDHVIQVSVEDSGCGIPVDALPRIFEPFEQVNTDITREHGGLGLGLAIVKGVVEQHGGRAWARSEGEGKGAAFVVELPNCDARPAEEIAESARTATPGKSGDTNRCVLLVEDHADTAKLLTRLLEMDGYDVAWAGSMGKALELAGQQNFDFVISDIGLPDASGHELMTELRNRHGLRGIALTGYGMEDDVARSRAAGFVGHIVKPVDYTQLRAAIQSLPRA